MSFENEGYKSLFQVVEIQKKNNTSYLFKFPNNNGKGQLKNIGDGNMKFVNVPKSFDAVISNDVNEGDFTSIAAGFTGSNKNIYVKNGTYVEASNIIIPDGGQLIGESEGNVIIDFTGPYCIKLDGSDGVKETTGTISISNNSNIVTGSGTIFTNLPDVKTFEFVEIDGDTKEETKYTGVAAGDFIKLGINYYEILSIDSNTQLTLKETYTGKMITNDPYYAQAMSTNCSISNLIVKNSSSSGIYIRALKNGHLTNIIVQNCSPCIDIVDSNHVTFNESTLFNSSGNGLNIINGSSLTFNSINVHNSNTNGIEISNASNNINLNNCISENNGNIGINIKDTSSFLNITATQIKNNNNRGIYSETGAVCNSIANCDISDNNGDGVEILGDEMNIQNCFILRNSNGLNIKSNNCNITDNVIKDCTSNGFYISGTKNKIDNNLITGHSINGIDIKGNDNVINNNTIEANISNNILLETGSSKNIIINNVIENLGSSFVDNGTGNMTLGNNGTLSASEITKHTSAIVHQDLNGAGTNTHAQIDTHIGDATIHRVINDSGTGATELWSASKINTELGGKTDSGHTHVASNITDFDTAADARITAQKGNANGLATLNGSTKIPIAQIDNTVAQWNANQIRSINVTTAAPMDKHYLRYYSTSDELQYERMYDIDTSAITIDDFFGSNIDVKWVIDTVGANSDVKIVDGVGGVVKLNSGANNNDYGELSLSTKNVDIACGMSIKIRLKISHVMNTMVEFGSIVDANQRMDFIYNETGSAGNWIARNTMAGVDTTTDTGVVGNTDWHIFRVVTSSSDIKFYIDDILKATHTTNLPTNLMKMYIKQTSNSANARNIELDFIEILSDRQGNVAGSGGGGGGGGCVIL